MGFGLHDVIAECSQSLSQPQPKQHIDAASVAVAQTARRKGKEGKEKRKKRRERKKEKENMSFAMWPPGGKRAWESPEISGRFSPYCSYLEGHVPQVEGMWTAT